MFSYEITVCLRVGVSMIGDSTKIILSLADIFDFSGYVNACEIARVQPVARGVFFQTAGMLEGAKRENPNDPVSAYIGMIAEMNTAINRTTKTNTINGKKCGGCGGGKVK